jgi:thioredoxin-like negative regulator of GroEL
MKKIKKHLEKNWGKWLIGILVATLALFIVFSEKPEKNTSITASKWAEKVNEDKYTVTVLTLSYCSAFKSFYPIISALQEEYGFDMYKFEIDTIAEDEYNKVTTTFEMKNYAGSVPYTVIHKNGEFIADNVGYIDRNATLEFLKSNGVITE